MIQYELEQQVFTDLKTNKNLFGYLDSVLAIVKYFICDDSILVERTKWFSREYDVLFIAITLVLNARSWKMQKQQFIKQDALDCLQYLLEIVLYCFSNALFL